MGIETILPNAAQFDATNEHLAAMNAALIRIASQMGAYDEPATWGAIQAAVRAGTIGAFVQPGDQLSVEVSGTAQDFDVLGLDEDAPVNAGLQHVLSIQAHDVLLNVKFDNPQYLFAVTAEACAAFGWPNSGMPAGTYHVILDHGAYGVGTEQDGSYQFTTTQPVPVGGGLRHSTMGTSQTGSYSKNQITEGTFVTYDADTVTELESGISCTEGNGGTCLGTTSASEAYKIGDYINYTIRQKYGSNRWSTSYLRQVLNSEDAELQWTPGTIWSRNDDSVQEGFLHSLAPELRAVLCPVRTRYALSSLDEGNYEDITDYVKVPTLLDLTGNAGSGVLEGPVDAQGQVARSTAYAMWQKEQTDADRIKYSGTIARNWWTGSASVTKGCLSRRVAVDGAFATTYANVTSSSAAPCLFIG